MLQFTRAQSRIFMFTAMLIWTGGSCVAAAAESNPVLASYDGKSITLKEFAKINPKLATWLGMGLEAEQVEAALDAIILNSLLAEEAKSEGLDRNPEVAIKIDRILAGAYLQREVPHSLSVPTQNDLKQYYNANLDKYKKPALITVSHILLSSLGEAHSIEAKLKAGESFDALAREHSSDPASSSRGGSLGRITLEDLTPELRQALHDLPVGETSGIIRSKFGYHILKVTERPAAAYKPYSEVVGEVNSAAARDKRQRLIGELRRKLWRKYDVSIDSAKVREIVKTPGAAAPGGRVVRANENPPPGAQPRLRFLSNTYDLGQVGVKPVLQSSLVVNEGDADLLIRKVSSNCGGCLSGAIKPSRLAPGEVGRLTFTFNPNLTTPKGRVEQLLFIESNDVDRAQQKLTINATIFKK
jgi:peptidyl-prolyl cis-trans isomerase C